LSDSAKEVGCDVGQIVKSLVFVADGNPFLALTSGSNHADPARPAQIRGAVGGRGRAGCGLPAPDALLTASGGEPPDLKVEPGSSSPQV